MQPYSLTFIINNAAFFVSHRLPIAVAAMRDGNHVELITGQAGSVAMEPPAERALADAGITHRRVNFSASSVNPLKEFVGLLQLIGQLRKHRPDVIHCASPKGNLYGGIAARVTGVPAIVFAISGMGYAYSDASQQTLSRRLISTIYRQMARLAFGHRNKCVIVQNAANRQFMLDTGLAQAADIHQIPGSGVDLSVYDGVEIEKKKQVVLLPSRMLLDKGIVEFVTAARHLKAKAPGWRFVLAGAADYDNPASVSQAQLEAWDDEGSVEWLGYVGDMVPLYREASIVCLPSAYGEGMPKVLLEAAAAGCATITTDTPGCNEAIIAGETGDLVPVNDWRPLADTLLALIDDRARRERYGYRGRELATQRYSIESVIEQTQQIYARLVETTRATP